MRVLAPPTEKKIKKHIQNLRCRYRRSFSHLPFTHFLLCDPVPNSPRTGTGPQPGSWGPLLYSFQEFFFYFNPSCCSGSSDILAKPQWKKRMAVLVLYWIELEDLLIISIFENTAFTSTKNTIFSQIPLLCLKTINELPLRLYFSKLN